MLYSFTWTAEQIESLTGEPRKSCVKFYVATTLTDYYSPGSYGNKPRRCCEYWPGITSEEAAYAVATRLVPAPIKFIPRFLATRCRTGEGMYTQLVSVSHSCKGRESYDNMLIHHKTRAFRRAYSERYAKHNSSYGTELYIKNGEVRTLNSLYSRGLATKTNLNGWEPLGTKGRMRLSPRSILTNKKTGEQLEYQYVRKMYKYHYAIWKHWDRPQLSE